MGVKKDDLVQANPTTIFNNIQLTLYSVPVAGYRGIFFDKIDQDLASGYKSRIPVLDFQQVFSNLSCTRFSIL